MIEIECKEAPILASSLSRCFANTTRISSLLSNYRDSNNSDILRMCVPFLHATIEDCMRNLLFFSLTNTQSKDLLNQVPLKGISNTGRSEKFLLGELAKFGNVTVKAIVEQSVGEYVNRLTFNSSKDIMNWIKKLKINDSEIVPMLSALDELISRRHNIVHNSDYSVNRSLLNSEVVVQLGTEDSYDFTSIDAEMIEKWLSVTSRFFMVIIPLFLPSGAKIKMWNV
ncbi:MAG: hypothetical protein JRE64_14615 [Deltaproteobacteria bacterium]|nr:hypothetical protein [Deltaproteobacteria bacterium]